MIKKMLFGVAVGVTVLSAQVPLEQKIGQMLMVGFHGTSAKPDSQICEDIRQYNLGAVLPKHR